MIDTHGAWLHFSGLAVETTPETLHEFLDAVGLGVGVENINLKRFTSSCNAVVSVTPKALAEFVNFQLGNTMLHGKSVCSVPFAERPRLRNTVCPK